MFFQALIVFLQEVTAEFPKKEEVIFDIMKPVLFLFFMLGGFAAAAQPYQSLFGKDSTRQNIVWLGIDFVQSDSIHVEKDTVVHGYTWKKLKNRTSNLFKGGLIREDTMSGKVWYKSLGTGDTATVLAFDFSLVKGDTFDLSTHWINYPVAQMIVDTTFNLNGRKIIQFKATVGMQFPEKIRFIEGTGSNLSLIYKDYHATLMMVYLLCSFKDGIQIYSNSFFSGQCWLVFTSANEPAALLTSVYPTIFTDKIIIDHPRNRKYTQVVLYHSSGRMVFSTPYNRIIQLPALPAGMYFLTLYSGNGSRITKKLIHR